MAYHLLDNYVKRNTTLRKKRNGRKEINNTSRGKCIISTKPKDTCKVPSKKKILVEKLKGTQLHCISRYMNMKRKNLVWAMNNGMHVNLTTCMSIPCQMLPAKGLSEFVLKRFF